MWVRRRTLLRLQRRAEVYATAAQTARAQLRTVLAARESTDARLTAALAEIDRLGADLARQQRCADRLMVQLLDATGHGGAPLSADARDALHLPAMDPDAYIQHLADQLIQQEKEGR